MAVVRDFYIGNTHVKIDDEYCRDKTPEEVQEILDRIADRAYRAIYGAEQQKKMEELQTNETETSNKTNEGAEDIS